MKKLISVVLALILAVPFALGQIAAKSPPPAPYSGWTALLFSFDGLSFIRAGNFDGGIGGKIYVSYDLAFRGVLRFTTASGTTPANPPAGQTGTDGEVSATQFGVSAAVEYHVRKGHVSPYAGVGVGFSTTSTEEKPSVVGNVNQSTTKNSRCGLTVNGVQFNGGLNFDFFCYTRCRVLSFFSL